MLFLDGVYVDQPDGTARFRWVKAPTNLAHGIAHRIGRFLERQGLLERDAGCVGVLACPRAMWPRPASGTCCKQWIQHLAVRGIRGLRRTAGPAARGQVVEAEPATYHGP